MKYRKILLSLSLAAGILVSGAESSGQSKEELVRTYSDRYNLIVSKLGPAGVGVETVLNQWEQADSADTDMLAAKFNYYFTKAQSTSVVTKSRPRYLGAEPLLELKDSTGAKVYYFQEVDYDDDIFSTAMRYLDKAIAGKPARIDLCLVKATALMSYEKDSPDMALSYLLGLADRNETGNIRWEYPGYELGDSFFRQSMQEFCHSFFSLGTPSAYEAFRTLSERMLISYPDDAAFITNLGTYEFIVAKDYGKARKYYKKALKLSPEDYSALKNSILLARQTGDRKSEKKYLAVFAGIAPEGEKAAAEARLQYLEENR